jgi:hypothetical protein
MDRLSLQAVMPCHFQTKIPFFINNRSRAGHVFTRQIKTECNSSSLFSESQMESILKAVIFHSRAHRLSRCDA